MRHGPKDPKLWNRLDEDQRRGNELVVELRPYSVDEFTLHGLDRKLLMRA